MTSFLKLRLRFEPLFVICDTCICPIRSGYLLAGIIKMMMRKEFPAFLLLLSLLGSCQGKFLQPLTAPLRFAKALRGQLTKIVLPDVYLPEDKSLFKGANFLSNLFDLTGISSIEILNFNMKGGAKAALAVRGKSKSDPTVFDDFHSNFVENIIQHKHLLPDGYKFFGSNNNVENLNLFIKHNPFAASALSKVGEKIAIVSMGDSAGPTSWFKRAVDLLDDSYPRVVATFSDDLTVHFHHYFIRLFFFNLLFCATIFSAARYHRL